MRQGAFRTKLHFVFWIMDVISAPGSPWKGDFTLKKKLLWSHYKDIYLLFTANQTVVKDGEQWRDDASLQNNFGRPFKMEMLSYTFLCPFKSIGIHNHNSV